VAAASVATTLLALPYATLLALDGANWWSYVPVGVAVIALIAVAVWLWAPLTALAAALLALACALLYFFGVAFAQTCGDSNVAGAVEWAGAAGIAVTIATWGVLGGARFIWRFPLAWVAAAAWVIGWAHVIPHGAGACFE
jgi:hypothetical protein